MKTLLFIIAVPLWPAAPTRVESPPPTYIVKDVCPFECCVYRAWHTKTDTVAYAKPDQNTKVVGLIKAGATVEALTGEVHSRPVRFVVKKPHAAYKPGDVLWVYTYVGEG